MKKVFYSWQSDSSYSRNLITKALKQACENCDKENKFLVEEATTNRTGSPDIADSIFTKIEESDVFVCDLSIINKDHANDRKTPNPNVLIELGFAAKALGWDRIICLFDEQTGRKEELPFDVRHRRITGLKATSNEKQMSNINKLSNDLLKYVNQIPSKASDLELLIYSNFIQPKMGEAISLTAKGYHDYSVNEIMNLVDLDALGVTKMVKTTGNSFFNNLSHPNWKIPTFDCKWIDVLVDKKIEHLERQEELKNSGYVISQNVTLSHVNVNYVEEYVRYATLMRNLAVINFKLVNNSELAFEDLRIELCFPIDSDITIMSFDRLPLKPFENNLFSKPSRNKSIYKYDLNGEFEKYSVKVEKLNIGDSHNISDSIYFIPKQNKVYNFSAKIYSDKAKPMEFNYSVEFIVERANLTFTELIEL